MTPVRDMAKRWVAAGISVVPIRPDGTKAPSISTWKEFQGRLPTEDEIELHFTYGVGIAVIGGAISGNLEMLDFDVPKDGPVDGPWHGRCFYDEWVEHLNVDLFALVQSMPVVRTPGGGVHLYYRCDSLQGNRKLALVLHPKDTVPPKETIIETRGEGGYVLAPGCPPECHPSGKTYDLISGSFESVPTISEAQRSALFSIARSFDQSGLDVKEARRKERAARPSKPVDPSVGLRPGDDFNNRGSWSELLEPLGWTLGYARSDGAKMWRRPGKKDRGTSATVRDFDGVELFHAFTSNCDPFPQEESINKFQAYTLIFHDGNFEDAARQLGKEGFGEPAKRPSWTPREDDPAAVVRGEEVPWTDAGSDDRSAVRDVDEATLFDEDVEGDEDFEPPWDDSEIPLELAPTAKSRIIEPAPERGDPQSGGDDPNRLGIRVKRGDEEIHYDDDERVARDIAVRILNEYEIRRDDAKCIYLYQNNYWKETSREFLEKLAMQYDTHNHVEMKILREAVNLAMTRKHVQTIEWNRLSDTEVAVKNGVLDFVTGKLREHDPEDYIDRLIPCEYDSTAQAPTWVRCLNDWLPEMPEEQNGLQQFFGYILMNHALYKKALLLYGKKDTGKSMVCSIGKALAGGAQFTCSITPEEMDDPRKLAPIKGKSLNVVADLEKDTVFADGGFKRLVSTGDMIQIDQKFKAAESYTPTAKHMFATNNLPTIKDVTDAVFTRLMFLTFDAQVPKGKQDRMLEKKLTSELTGILNWAVEGAKKLHAAEGHWPKITSSEILIESYKLDQNPLTFYIRESGQIIEDDRTFVEVEKLRKQMNEFMGGKGYGRHGFSRLVRGLTEVMPGVSRGRSQGGRAVLRGLDWSDAQMRLDIVAPEIAKPGGAE